MKVQTTLPLDTPPAHPCIRLRLDQDRQKRILGSLDPVIAEAPFGRYTMPGTGAPFSALMTNCGRLGWVADRAGGYRYQTTHPENGRPWPAIPQAVMAVWQEVLPEAEVQPDACLINLYRGTARLGLHRDTTEADTRHPVLSISLGATAWFRLGGLKRSGPTVRFPLESGDVMVLAGPDRLCHHGVDRILPGSSTLIDGGGRLSLTLRVAG